MSSWSTGIASVNASRSRIVCSAQLILVQTNKKLSRSSPLVSLIPLDLSFIPSISLIPLDPSHPPRSLSSPSLSLSSSSLTSLTYHEKVIGPEIRSVIEDKERERERERGKQKYTMSEVKEGMRIARVKLKSEGRKAMNEKRRSEEGRRERERIHTIRGTYNAGTGE